MITTHPTTDQSGFLVEHKPESFSAVRGILPRSLEMPLAVVVFFCFSSLCFYFWRWFGGGGIEPETKFNILTHTFAFGYGLRMRVQEDVLFLKIVAVGLRSGRPAIQLS